MTTITLRLGDCTSTMAAMSEGSVGAIVCDPPYGLEFMGKEWDRLDWQAGVGFAKPGIGDRKTAWPSYSSTGAHGAANPTCALCGGRLRGVKKCSCDQPHDHWKPIGKRRNQENEGLPVESTAHGSGKHLNAIFAWHVGWLREAFRVLKPGGVIKAFSGTRTYHRLAAAMEEVGFDLVPLEAWVYGSGFPKSLDVSKAIDKVGGFRGWSQFRSELAKAIQAAGLTFAEIDRALGVQATSCYWVRTDHRACFPAKHHWEALSGLLNLSSDLRTLHGEVEREIIAAGTPKGKSRGVYGDFATDEYNYTAPATDAARQWEGWGTAIKPAWEPVVVGRKPLWPGQGRADDLDKARGAVPNARSHMREGR